MHILAYVFLFASVLLSGLSYFMIRKPSQYLLKLLLSFSGAFLFALSVLHLMPEVYQHNTASIGIWIMLGFFLQIIMEFFSEGIEHGHVHIHHEQNMAFPLTMMISLCLHSFLEGIPLAGDTSKGIGSGDNSLLIGIILHHIPVAFALVSMLVASGINKTKVIVYLSLFAVMAPLGAMANVLLGSGILSDMESWYDKIMAVVIGIFLHISTTILFESSNDHRFNFYKIMAIVTGGIMGIIVS